MVSNYPRCVAFKYKIFVTNKRTINYYVKTIYNKSNII